MPETTPLIKAALNLRVGAGFDVYESKILLPNYYYPNSNIQFFHYPLVLQYLHTLFCYFVALISPRILRID